MNRGLSASPLSRKASQVVVGDLLRRVLPLDRTLEVAFQRVPPDRAADGEADETVDWCGLGEPVVDLGVASAAA